MLLLVCAHLSEAKPLIFHFGLKKNTNAQLFPVYHNPDEDIALTLTGTGKTAAAAACMHLAHTLPASANDAWINIGIAGHGVRKIGEAVIVHKVTDAGTDRVWYPQFSFSVDSPTDTCVTVDKPQSEYGDYLCDMEASGIFDTVTRITTLEMTHSLKVVSDNSDRPHENIDKVMVTEMITAVMPTIITLASNALALSTELKQINQSQLRMPAFLEQWHFTCTQEHMLEVLLRRWQCLKPEIDPLLYFQSSRSAKNLLATMQTELDSSRISFVTEET